MIRNLVAGLFAATFAVSVALPALADDAPAPQDFKAGLLGKPVILLPPSAVTGMIYLFSDIGGWTAEDQATAVSLQAAGAAVVGVDTKQFLQTLEADMPDECTYLVSDIEELSHEIQRSLQTPIYHSPVIAGTGVGATLGLAIAAQTPDATMGRTVSVDPALILPLVRPLCTDAPKKLVAGGGGGRIYGLAEGDLTNPVDVLLTPTAPADAEAHVAEMQKQGFAIKTKTVTGTSIEALAARLRDLLAPVSSDIDPLADLGLVELPATASMRSMAIIYSGDGGWRDIDKSIGDILQKEGIPTVGVDTLRYFWSKKTPEQTAADLGRIIMTYSGRWNVDRVLLIGYSFGADVLPNAYNRLPADAKDLVTQISLLGIGSTVDYEVSVTEFLGTSGGDATTLPDLQQIKPSIIQCVYGEEEDDSACPKLAGTGAELVKTTGGHHFDGDYDALTAKIVDGLKRRIGAGDHPQAQAK